METGTNLQLEEMRTFVFEALRYFNSQPDYTTNYPDIKEIGNLQSKIEDLIFSKHSTSFAARDKRMNENNRRYFLEAIHNLLNEGVIMWGNAFDSDTKTHPYFSITSYGQKVLQHNKIIPHDPDNYLADLNRTIPKLDKLVLMYIEESIQCFLRNNQIASSVMLGVAAEAVFYQLFEWMKKNATNPNFIRKIQLVENKISIKNKQDVIFSEIKQNKGKLEPSISENIEKNLDGIGTFIRLQRNDSGHPTGTRKTRDEMFVNLRLFIPYCKQVYDLIIWLDKQHKKNVRIF